MVPERNEAHPRRERFIRLPDLLQEKATALTMKMVDSPRCSCCGNRNERSSGSQSDLTLTRPLELAARGTCTPR